MGPQEDDERPPGPYGDISLTVDDSIATITLQRPEALNAFTRRMADELIRAFEECDRDERVRAIVMTGAGRAFCAGADLAEAEEIFTEWSSSSASRPAPESDRPEQYMHDSGGRVTLRMFDSLKPIVVAINGPAVGVGLTLTLAADIRIAADTARMGFVFSRRGLTPESCCSWFLPRVVQMQQALEWVLSGRVFDAREALRGGLVRSTHPADQLMAEAYALAGHLTSGTAPVSVAIARRLLWHMAGEKNPLRAHAIESRALLARGLSDDVKEGITAFLEKRPPLFRDTVDASHLARLGLPAATSGAG